MPLHFSFKPGSDQSLEATRYFALLGAELFNAYLPSTDPKQLLLSRDGYAPLPLRIWTSRAMGYERASVLMPWLRDLAEGTHGLSRQPSDTQEAMRLVDRWMDVRHGEETFFLEILNPAHVFTADEEVELSIGVVGGETVMLSARNVMFMKIGPGLFGLSLAGAGSLLVEQVAAKRSEVVHAWRV